MLGCRSSGLRPTPSIGATATRSNGGALNSSSAAKNVPSPSSTAVAYGATSRRRPRSRNRQSALQTESSQNHSSSEPSCEDQAAAAR